MEKKRVIVDYHTLPPEVLEMMAAKYPNGFESDIIKFPNAKGELISAVRMETETIIYLVKVSTELRQMVEDYDVDEVPDVEVGEELAVADDEEEEEDDQYGDKPEDDGEDDED